MRATIQDAQALRSIGPIDLTAYLRAGGWQECARPANGNAAIWTWANPAGAEFEVLVPLDRNLRDYAARIGEALATMEVVEERSQLDILSDVTTASADIIRIPLKLTAAADGTVPIDDGSRVVQHARDMMLAAACAAVERRGYFATRKPTQAVDYVRKVRLGQTERGSYVLTVHSRVPPALQAQMSLTDAEGEDEPFERQVTKTLARSLAAASAAAETAVAAADLRAFEDAVRLGVSANLCDAIVGMASGGDLSDVEVGLTWARTRPVPPQTPQRFVFSADALPVIAEAGRLLKEAAPLEVSEVEGFVVRLDHEPDPTSPGRITLQGVVEGQLRKIGVELRTEDYQHALEAHGNWAKVRYRGELAREGRSLVIRNPSFVPYVDEE